LLAPEDLVVNLIAGVAGGVHDRRRHGGGPGSRRGAARQARPVPLAATGRGAPVNHRAEACDENDRTDQDADRDVDQGRAELLLLLAAKTTAAHAERRQPVYRSWCFEMRNIMDDYPARSGAEKSVLDAVLTAYRQVLDDPSVSPDDDFFELGGDSFQAMDIMTTLEETVGKQINAGVIFAFPTATGLARAITKTADASS
jgi:acyl carrier protein